MRCNNTAACLLMWSFLGSFFIFYFILDFWLWYRFHDFDLLHRYEDERYGKGAFSFSMTFTFYYGSRFLYHSWSLSSSSTFATGGPLRSQLDCCGIAVKIVFLVRVCKWLRYFQVNGQDKDVTLCIVYISGTAVEILCLALLVLLSLKRFETSVTANGNVTRLSNDSDQIGVMRNYEAELQDVGGLLFARPLQELPPDIPPQRLQGFRHRVMQMLKARVMGTPKEEPVSEGVRVVQTFTVTVEDNPSLPIQNDIWYGQPGRWEP